MNESRTVLHRMKNAAGIFVVEFQNKYFFIFNHIFLSENRAVRWIMRPQIILLSGAFSLLPEY